MLSELYGSTGWQYDFKGQKATGDWQALFGINLRCQHLSWYCMEGESKRDYPGSILHQSTYWQDYSYLETYFARFGLMMMQGSPICDVLVINPIESIWPQIHIGWAKWISLKDEMIGPIEHNYTTLFHMLAKNHIDFDYGEEQMMIHHAKVEVVDGSAVLRVGQAVYRTVIVSGMRTMRPTTLALLKEFVAAGGKVIFAGDAPDYVDAQKSDLPAQLAMEDGCIKVDFVEDEVVNAVRSFVSCDIVISSNKILSQARYDEENASVYVAMINKDRKEAVCDITLSVDVATLPFYSANADVVVEQWDLATGVRYKVPYAIDNGVLTVDFDMYAAGDKFLVFTTASAEHEALSERKQKIQVADVTVDVDDTLEFDYKLSEQNVCVLDMCQGKFDGQIFTGEALKVDRMIRKQIGIENRGGEMLQPWFTKLNCKDVYGPVELEYEFYCDIVPQGVVYLAAERPENFEYSINGIKLENKDSKDFWIDVAFKKLYIPEGAIKVGRNVVTAKVDFMRSTNIESLYLVGDFGVHLDGTKRTLTALPGKVGLKNIVNYDLPFYSGKITYVIPCDVIKAAKADAKMIKINGFCGSLLKVGGSKSDESIVIGWDPYEADISKFLDRGEDIELTLVCSRRNTYGPLHLVPALQGAYGPGHWVTGGDNWSDDYVLIDSGVFKIALS